MICIRRCPNLFHYQLTMKQMMLFMECMMMYYHQFSNSNNFYCLSEVQGASSWDSIRVRFQVAVLLQHGHGLKNRGTNRKKIPPGKLACPPKRGQLPLIPYNFSCPIHQKKWEFFHNQFHEVIECVSWKQEMEPHWFSNLNKNLGSLTGFTWKWEPFFERDCFFWKPIIFRFHSFNFGCAILSSFRS